ncbi:primary-amine oxidase [Gordonia sp. NPDC003376]
MAITTTEPTVTAPSVDHPLSPITAAEIATFREVLAEAGLASCSTRFGYVMLNEPHKRDVLAWRTGDPITREIGAISYDRESGEQYRLVVDVVARSLVSHSSMDPVVDGAAPFLMDEYGDAAEILGADPDVRQKLIEHGVVDVTRVSWEALAGGSLGYEDEVGVRVCRVVPYLRAVGSADDGTMASYWGSPIEGLAFHVDLSNRKVLRIIDTGQYDIPTNSRSNFHNPEVRGAERTDLTPIEVNQPQGPSFTLHGHRITWGRWSARIGFSAREGVTLHQITYTDVADDGTRVERPVIYRASLAEMVVNYGELTPTRAWQNYFDAGEYQFGRFVSSLELGCDCLGDITYLPVTFADDLGRPVTVENGICIHEEDTGIAWKHVDSFTDRSDVRRNRRLVISTFLKVGNYDYGFYWYLYLDGRVELEVKATGILYTSGVHDGSNPYSPQVAPLVGAPVHQHLFNVRLDMTVDGPINHVDEIDVVRTPMDDDNPWGGAFRATETRLLSERIAGRVADPSAGRVWRIASGQTTNGLGKAPAYVLHPTGSPLLMAAEDSPIAQRAAFATKHLWVTRYDPAEMWPAGYAPNQHPGGAGIPEFIADDAHLDDVDLVVWHTFGLTHVPRPEDWPVMPVDHTGFTLSPNGFFDRNPVLDLPAGAGDHCHHSPSDGPAETETHE